MNAEEARKASESFVLAEEKKYPKALQEAKDYCEGSINQAILKGEQQAAIFFGFNSNSPLRIPAHKNKLVIEIKEWLKEQGYQIKENTSKPETYFYVSWGGEDYIINTSRPKTDPPPMPPPPTEQESYGTFWTDFFNNFMRKKNK